MGKSLIVDFQMHLQGSFADRPRNFFGGLKSTENHVAVISFQAPQKLQSSPCHLPKLLNFQHLTNLVGGSAPKYSNYHHCLLTLLKSKM